jgi:hypothetical protein
MRQAYREEVSDLAVWCQDNNLSRNVSETKGDEWSRKRRAIHINGTVVELIESSVSTSLRNYYGPHMSTQS